jgi:phosphoribosylglycinamide formyltransferase-1
LRGSWSPTVCVRSSGTRLRHRKRAGRPAVPRAERRARDGTVASETTPFREDVLHRRLVVLVSGSGTNLQALLDACGDPAYGAEVVAVGADRDGIEGLARAERAGVPTFVHRVAEFPDRAAWDAALTKTVAAYEPDLVVLAGFMKLTGPEFLARFGGRTVNTHPALSPSFPGMHGPRDALAYGVKVTGCTLFLVDAGVDTGAVVAQAAVPVLDDDDEATLHERIKSVERQLLVGTVGRMAREGWTVTGRKVTIP